MSRSARNSDERTGDDDLDDVKRVVRKTCPSRMDDLWGSPEDKEGDHPPFDGPMNSSMRSIEHWHAQNVEVFAADDIPNLLRDKSRCAAFASSLGKACFLVGLTAQQVKNQLELPDFAVLVSPCTRCNTVYDNGGCVHENRREPLRISMDGTMLWHEPFRIRLHRAVKLMELACALLARGGQNGRDVDDDRGEDVVLARFLVPESPPGIKPCDFTTQCLRDQLSDPNGMKGIIPITQLVGILDNCYHLCPKAAQCAGGLLSLAVSRRPSVALSLIDADMLSQALKRYLDMVFGLVSNSNCVVEETIGIVAFINLLPLLYFLSDWKEARTVLPKHQLPAVVATVMLNILHSVHYGIATDDERIDRAPDLKTLPELRSATIVIGPLIGGGERGAMLSEKPMSFAVAASLEVLGRWAHKGVPVSSGLIPTDKGREPVSDCVEEYLPHLDKVIDRAPAMAFSRPIAEAIAAGDRARMPTQDASLLRQPILGASMRCALSSCSRTEAEGGGPLMICAGGCKGLARYCSGKHQVEHWKQHKYFCRRQEEK